MVMKRCEDECCEEGVGWIRARRRSVYQRELYQLMCTISARGGGGGGGAPMSVDR